MVFASSPISLLDFDFEVKICNHDWTPYRPTRHPGKRGDPLPIWRRARVYIARAQPTPLSVRPPQASKRTHPHMKSIDAFSHTVILLVLALAISSDVYQACYPQSNSRMRFSYAVTFQHIACARSRFKEDITNKLNNDKQI